MCILISNLKFYEFYIKIVFFLTNFQFPIAAIPSALTLLVSVGVSTKVYLVKKAYAQADLEAQAKFSNVLKEITLASHDKKDKILGNCFPYASKFARSVIGLIELYVSMHLYILLDIELSTLDLLCKFYRNVLVGSKRFRSGPKTVFH